MGNERNCRSCGEGALIPVLSLGQSPIANAFLREEDLNEEEYFFPLELGFCERCYMAQLLHTVDPPKLFHDKYAYYSSTSRTMQAHFKRFAYEITQNFVTKEHNLVVELGSNDGIMLEAFDARRVRALGIEPSANVAEAALRKGLETMVEFFNEDVARRIVEKHGKAIALAGANVICHIPDMNALLRAADILLADDGVFVFEDPSLAQIIEKTAYDQIYDEHVYYFSITSIEELARRHGFRVFHVAPQPTHGGSNRIYLSKQASTRTVIDSVQKILHAEADLGLRSVATFETFARRVEQSRNDLRGLLQGLKSEGKKLAGYAASSKGNVVLNYCQIGPDTLDFISDSTPAKQGMYTPGMHIPVVSPEHFEANRPDYALLLSWNHANEIWMHEKAFRENGGKFITHVPNVHVMS